MNGATVPVDICPLLLHHFVQPNLFFSGQDSFLSQFDVRQRPVCETECFELKIADVSIPSRTALFPLVFVANVGVRRSISLSLAIAFAFLTILFLNLFFSPLWRH